MYVLFVISFTTFQFVFVCSVLLLFCFSDANTINHSQWQWKWCQTPLPVTHYTSKANGATPNMFPAKIALFVIPWYHPPHLAHTYKLISPIIPDRTLKSNFYEQNDIMMIHPPYLKIQWCQSLFRMHYHISLCLTLIPLSLSS